MSKDAEIELPAGAQARLEAARRGIISDELIAELADDLPASTAGGEATHRRASSGSATRVAVTCLAAIVRSGPSKPLV